ncbi:MAG: endonuclease III [Clostridia bacterium]|nr:endonuclease III [Clostridia bacterium]
MTKKEKVEFLREKLCELYGDAPCTLEYKDPFHLIVAAQLAAQCTDARVNLVTPALFARFPDAEAFAGADTLELEKLIHSTGFYHNKAKNLKKCGQVLLSDFGGVVPDNIDDLLKLPGVGRKIANLVVGDVFGKPAIVVDTHCKRITGLLGLTKNTDPTKIEKDLVKIIPPEYSALFCHQIVEHGRNLCIARRPKCAECPLAPACDFAVKESKKTKKERA